MGSEPIVHRWHADRILCPAPLQRCQRLVTHPAFCRALLSLFSMFFQLLLLPLSFLPLSPIGSSFFWCHLSSRREQYRRDTLLSNSAARLRDPLLVVFPFDFGLGALIAHAQIAAISRVAISTVHVEVCRRVKRGRKFTGALLPVRTHLDGPLLGRVIGDVSIQENEMFPIQKLHGSGVLEMHGIPAPMGVGVHPADAGVVGLVH